MKRSISHDELDPLWCRTVLQSRSGAALGRFVEVYTHRNASIEPSKIAMQLMEGDIAAAASTTTIAARALQAGGEPRLRSQALEELDGALRVAVTARLDAAIGLASMPFPSPKAVIRGRIEHFMAKGVDSIQSAVASMDLLMDRFNLTLRRELLTAARGSRLATVAESDDTEEESVEDYAEDEDGVSFYEDFSDDDDVQDAQTLIAELDDYLRSAMYDTLESTTRIYEDVTAAADAVARRRVWQRAEAAKAAALEADRRPGETIMTSPQRELGINAAVAALPEALRSQPFFLRTARYHLDTATETLTPRQFNLRIGALIRLEEERYIRGAALKHQIDQHIAAALKKPELEQHTAYTDAMWLNKMEDTLQFCGKLMLDAHFSHSHQATLMGMLAALIPCPSKAPLLCKDDYDVMSADVARFCAMEAAAG